MLTVILGAGASFDSAPINASTVAKENSWRPPLTKDLFHADSVWFAPRTLPLPPDLITVLERIRRETANQSLELALERLKSESNQFPDRWRQLLAVREWIVTVLTACTSKWLLPLKHATTIVDLVDRLNNWRHRHTDSINFITFNYDTLLEKATTMVKSNHPQFQEFSNYITDEYKIFKPHGSVDWQWQVRHDENRVALRDGPLSDAEESSMELCLGTKRDEMWQLTAGGPLHSHMSAVAIPVVSKSYSDFVFPPDHETQMYAALESTTALLVIGWAGAEEHFMTEVASRVCSNVPTLIVCGDGGAATEELLRTKGKLTNVTNSSKGFAAFLNTSDLETWLEQVKQ